MAGSYPDAPGRRMAYHEDGTVMWRWAGDVAVAWSSLGTGKTFYSTAQKSVANNEADDVAGSAQGASQFFAVIFPEPRDIDGWYIHWTGQNTDALRHLEWSADSNNGISGTWTSILTARDNPVGSNINRYRTEIDTYAASSVRSMRFIIADTSSFSTFGTLYSFHIYGAISAGETPDRLLFINQSTGLEFDAVHDWGDVPRGTVLEKDIRIKNNSASLAASDIDLDFAALTLTSDTWHTISDSGGAYANTLNIPGPLAAGASYPAADVLTIKLTVAGDEDLGLHSAYLSAFAGSWA